LVIAPLCIYLGCRDTITTPVVIERGRLVGVGSGPVCYGEGKRYRAEEWAQYNQISLENSVAYADNWSDRSLLERVGRAVVVHPRGRLLRLARARGWFVVRPEPPQPAKSTPARTLRQRLRRRS